MTNFWNDLEIGQLGEREVGEALGLEKAPHKHDDLIDPKTGERLEVKTRTKKNQRDFNVELSCVYDNGARIVPGGPWQTLLRGTEKTSWFFKSTGKLFIFDTAELVAELNRIKDRFPVWTFTSTSNGDSWVSNVIFIPRAELTHLPSCKQVKIKQVHKRTVK